jgi:hypothetical protein
VNYKIIYNPAIAGLYIIPFNKIAMILKTKNPKLIRVKYNSSGASLASLLKDSELTLINNYLTKSLSPIVLRTFGKDPTKIFLDVLVASLSYNFYYYHDIKTR